jgi:hypothetical protein
MISGVMGVGKTTVSQFLKNKLPNCVFLDGDWCWDMHPFQVTQETKAMVIENICFLLNNFIQCSCYQNIIFCWVMHEQVIIDTILSKLDLTNCQVINLSLICSKEALQERLQKDIKEGKRDLHILKKSLSYLPLYEDIQSIKIDVSNQSIESITQSIIDLQNT